MANNHPALLNVYTACIPDSIRLVGGTGNYSGRVEVCINGTETYGTVCNDRWDVLEARVVCTQLGFSSEGWWRVVGIAGSVNLKGAYLFINNVLSLNDV